MPWGHRRPRVHRHWVGIIQEEGAGFGDCPDVAAEIKDARDVALAVHDAADAERVPNALIDAIFQRDVDIGCKGWETTDPGAVNDIICAGQCAPPIRCGGDGGRQVVFANVLLAKLADHVEVAPRNIGEGELRVGKFGHREDVAQQCAGESNATGADESNFNWHK